MDTKIMTPTIMATENVAHRVTSTSSVRRAATGSSGTPFGSGSSSPLLPPLPDTERVGPWSRNRSIGSVFGVKDDTVRKGRIFGLSIYAAP